MNAGIGKKWKCDGLTDGRTEGQTDVKYEIVTYLDIGKCRQCLN